MPKKKKDGAITLSSKQVGALALCVVAIAALSLLAGYISGKMFSKGASIALQQEKAPEVRFGGRAPMLLDPEKVKKETTFEPDAQEEFTFHKKLTKESDPALKPLRKSDGAPDTGKPAPPAVEKTAAAERKPAPVETPKSAPRKRKTSSAKPVPKAVSKALTKKLTIQVGSFKNRKDAEILAEKLNKSGYYAYILPFRYKGQTWRRVRVGVFQTTASAKRASRKLERELKLPALLVSYQKAK